MSLHHRCMLFLAVAMTAVTATLFAIVHPERWLDQLANVFAISAAAVWLDYRCEVRLRRVNRRGRASSDAEVRSLH